MDNALTLTRDIQRVLGFTVLTMVLFLFERIRADEVRQGPVDPRRQRRGHGVRHLRDVRFAIAGEPG